MRDIFVYECEHSILLTCQIAKIVQKIVWKIKKPKIVKTSLETKPQLEVFCYLS